MGLDFKLWQSRFADYMRLRNWSARTIEGYGYMLGRFFRFLEGQEVHALSELTRDVIYEFRSFLYHTTAKGNRLAPRTQVLNLCAVKMFCHFLTQDRYILLDPAADVELPKAPDTLPRLLLKEWEVKRLLEAPDVSLPQGLRDRAALELLYCSGIRSTECCELECADVDFGKLDVHVVEGKGAKGRRVPLGDEAAYWLELYLREARPAMDKGLAADRLFLNRRGKPLVREVLIQIVGQASERAGLAYKATPHLLRYACATHCLKRGMGLRHLQILLGHASVESTQRYLRIEISDLQEVHRRCHPRENGVPQ